MAALRYTVSKKACAVFVISGLTLACLYLNSTTLFRIRLADYYVKIQRYDKAISTYKRALRKERLFLFCPVFDSDAIPKIGSLNSVLTDTYFTAVQHHFFQAKNYFRVDNLTLNRLDEAMVEYQIISKLYGDYQETFTFIPYTINAKWQQILAESRLMKIEACFRFGKEYVKKEMWLEAKYFFTKRILKYINPIDVIEILDKSYKNSSDVKNKIWGSNTFVTLEGFENTSKPVLEDWVRDTEPTVNIHTISMKVSRTGNCSEYLDLSYKKRGYNYFVKTVNIPLTNPELKLGVRLYLKGEEPFRGFLKVNIYYPKQKAGAVLQTDIKKDIFNGWEERRIENLYEKAKIIAMQQNWNTDGMMINQIFIDTQGYSNKFYVDDIELYVINMDEN